jgi:hypothetical protein
MSEPVIAAAEAVAAPLLKEAEAALAPEAKKVLEDLHAFVSDEADRLRTQLPVLVQDGVTHLHNLAAEMLGRYQSVMERIDGHLTGTVTAAPAQPTAPVAVDPTQAPSTTTEASSAPSSTPSTSTDTPAA